LFCNFFFYLFSACFNQAFKEQVNAQFGFFSPVKTIDPKVDTTIDILNRLMKYIKQPMTILKR